MVEPSGKSGLMLLSSSRQASLYQCSSTVRITRVIVTRRGAADHMAGYQLPVTSDYLLPPGWLPGPVTSGYLRAGYWLPVTSGFLRAGYGVRL